MKKIKFYLRWTVYIFSTCLLLIGAYVLAAIYVPKIAVEKEAETKPEVPIYILTNGMHTDLVLPIRNEQKDWSQEILFKNTVSKDTVANWVALGWGDKGFYLYTPTWGDLTFKTAFRAAFGLSTAAIHATFYEEMKESPVCKKMEISQEQYARLINYVQNSFLLNDDKQLIHIETNANYGQNDAFYEAVGSYHLFHTCNTWANNGLKNCGQKACFWTPTDKGIFNQYSVNN